MGHTFMKFNKLVRDKVPQTIKQKGILSVIHIASRDEYWRKLKDKLHEEVKEFVESESVEELADVLEVLDAMAKFKKFKKNKRSSAKNKKAKERGKFKKRIILEETKNNGAPGRR